MQRIILPVLALVIAASCSLIPLDEYGEAGTGSQAGSTAGGGGAGAQGGGGAGPFVCTDEYATDKDNCGEPGYVCEETCADCMCTWWSVTSLQKGGNGAYVLDFDLEASDGALSYGGPGDPDPVYAILPFSVLADGWLLTDEFFVLGTAAERVVVGGENPRRLFYSNVDGISTRTLEETPVDTALCDDDDDETWDHLALGNGRVFRSRYGAGFGRIEQCNAGIGGLGVIGYGLAHTDAAWEIEATASTVFWTNRKLGGGVYSKPAAALNFETSEPDELFQRDDAVPHALEVIQGTAYFTECAGGHIYERPGSEEPLVAGLSNPIFMVAVDEGVEVPTFYVIEANDSDFDCTTNFPVTMDASLVRYRGSQRRVLADHIGVPTTLKVFGGHVYFPHHIAEQPAEIYRVPR